MERIQGFMVHERAKDVALLIIRLALGWIFIYHGAGKLFGYAQQGGLSSTKDYFVFLGIKPAGFWALAASSPGSHSLGSNAFLVVLKET